MTARTGLIQRKILTAIGALALVARGSFAVAQPIAQPAANPRLVLQVAGCADEQGVRAAIAVEVGDLLLEPGAPPTDGDDRLSVVCAGTAASVEAQAASAHGPVRREIQLGAFPADAAARALALAGLETLAEVSPVVQQRLQDRARGTASNAPQAAPPPVQRRSSPLLPEPAQPRPPRVFVTLSGAWRGFAAEHGASLWGGQAGIERTIGERWNGELNLDAGFGRRTKLPGTVDIRAASLGGFWELRARWDWFTGLVGVGGRAGLVNLAGHGSDATVVGESVVRPWAGPAMRARAMLGRGMWWTVVVTAELGVAVRGAEGVVNGDTAVALSGAWLAIGAGIGIRL